MIFISGDIFEQSDALSVINESSSQQSIQHGGGQYGQTPSVYDFRDHNVQQLDKEQNKSTQNEVADEALNLCGIGGKKPKILMQNQSVTVIQSENADDTMYMYGTSGDQENSLMQNKGTEDEDIEESVEVDNEEPEDEVSEETEFTCEVTVVQQGAWMQCKSIENDHVVGRPMYKSIKEEPEVIIQNNNMHNEDVEAARDTLQNCIGQPKALMQNNGLKQDEYTEEMENTLEVSAARHDSLMKNYSVENEKTEETLRCVDAEIDNGAQVFDVYLQNKHTLSTEKDASYMYSEHIDETNCKSEKSDLNVKWSAEILGHITEKEGDLRDKPHKCDLCNYCTKFRCNLEKHKRNHSIERPYKCDLCDYSARQPYTLKKHERNKHQKGKQKRPYKCDMCSYRAPHPSTLVYHKRKHMEEKTYKCDLCDYSTKWPASLSVHKTIHTGEKPLQCEFCGFSTRWHGDLLRHKKTHFKHNKGEEIKRFNCNFCDFRATTSAQVTVHERTHTGERPYQCDLCNYSCASRSGLTNHKRQHTVDKPFKCPYCDYCARQPQVLKRHIGRKTQQRTPQRK